MDGCLELLGSYELADLTRNELVELARSEGEINTGAEEFGYEGRSDASVHRIDHRVPIRIM